MTRKGVSCGMRGMYYPAVSDCERRFMEGGPFYHLCTPPLEKVLLQSTVEMDMALNFLAIAALASGIRLLAFALMSNHFHFVVEGEEGEAHSFYRNFRGRVAQCLARAGRFKDVMAAEEKLIPIESLKQLRDEIAYVIRNPFVSQKDVHLFSYRWCSGYMYFNGLQGIIQEGTRVCDWPLARRRAFNRRRDGSVDSRIRAVDGVALPGCFTDYRRAMSFFENARQFVLWTMKNVESQVAIAKRVGETIQLDDMELTQEIFRICRERFRASSPKDLSQENRVGLIKTLKYDYDASNRQIARCMGVSVGQVDAIFPLSAKG